MDRATLLKLDLRAPLEYTKTEDFTLNITENDEFLLCFELDPVQSRSIEPERGLLLGDQIFAGRKSGDSGSLQAQKVTLPAGEYLFIQCRKALEQEKWLDMAMEQQKDGLWERHKLKNLLYVRYLYEDGAPVTQLFRPVKG
ncbi:MAG: hypothetical protein LBH44_04770 [Treponema sp.]|jgi:hypothetical protein|nr:hypothetical protein [Treponema sp.]